jgi:hypothetical protein
MYPTQLRYLHQSLRRQVVAQREPVSIDPAPKSRAATSWDVVTSAGFRLLGEWTRDPESALRLDAKPPRVPGIYAFVVDDVVVYVGLTMNGPAYTFRAVPPGTQAPAHQRAHQRPITSTLAAAKPVKVLVATPEPSEWNGLPVNTAAGLEAGLIARIGRILNIIGVR